MKRAKPRKAAKPGARKRAAAAPAAPAEERAELRAGDEVEENDDGLREAEAELGISEWIDPDTGGPAEDSVPRIEDH